MLMLFEHGGVEYKILRRRVDTAGDIDAKNSIVYVDWKMPKKFLKGIETFIYYFM